MLQEGDAMSVKTKALSFAGQTFYLGIDTHKSNWKVVIRSNQVELKTFSMNPAPEELVSYMRKNYPGGRYRSVYEAGFCGYWPDRALRRLGFENIIVNPADVPSTNKEKDRKSDGIDGRKLSRERENHSLTGIYVPTPQVESHRSVSRLWRQYSERGAQIKNRIKCFLNFTGIPIPEGHEGAYWSNNYLTMLSKLVFEESYNRTVLDMHLEELRHIRQQRKVLLREIRAIVKDVPIIPLLRTVPGVGQIVGFVLYAELIDIQRFKNLDDLLSFIGLVPSEASSDTTVVKRGITSRHCRHLRPMLIESAWMAIRNDPAMTAAFAHLVKRMSKQRAVLRIAKKLVNRIRYVWLHQKPYVTAVVA